MTSKVQLGLIQMAVSCDKTCNLQNAARFVRQLASRGAQIVALPECFNSPYGTQYFNDYAEQIPGGLSSQALSDMARENKVYLVGGSIPERADCGRLYNTCSVFDPNGSLIATHRKVHLFDIDIPGKITFKESDVLTSGDKLTTFDTSFGKIGIAICYDMRFPEITTISARQGCKMMFFPGAFNMTTGPMHWQLLLRSRALDNQIFVAGISPARDETSSYVAWGQSTVVDPQGQVICEMGHAEDVALVEIDLNSIDETRARIPVTKQRRFDVYPDISSKIGE